MIASKFIFSENIGVKYDTLTLNLEMQEYLETDGLALIHAYLSEHGKNLPYAPMVQECLITAARAMLNYDAARHTALLSTYITEAIKNCVKMEKRRLCSEKARGIRMESPYEHTALSFRAWQKSLSKELWHDYNFYANRRSELELLLKP